MKYLAFVLLLLLAAVSAAFFLRMRRRAAEEAVLAQAAKQEFFSRLALFSGCFQVLYDAVEQSDALLAARALKQWEKRASQLPQLSQYLMSQGDKSSPLHQASRWLGILESWGVVHDAKGQELTAGKEQERLYIFDDIYTEGEAAIVIRPAWYCMDKLEKRCLEKGAASLES